MFLVLTTLCDPFANNLDLRLCHRFFRLGRWHDFLGILAEHAAEHFGRVSVARYERTRFCRTIERIQTKTGFPTGFIETVTVEAGTFDCFHFRYVDDAGPGMGRTQHPSYDMWVTKDDFIFVQGGVGGYMATWYELIELDRPTIG